MDAALWARRALLADPMIEALRLIHGDGDDLPGLMVDRFGDVLIVNVLEGSLVLEEPLLAELMEELRRRVGARGIYRKVFARDRSEALASLESAHRDPKAWIGQDSTPQFAIHEHGVAYLVRPFDGYAVGLFLENRGNRAWVRGVARHKRVLNLFSYTCGFSVAAAVGGARETTSVDVSAKALSWGRENLAANGLAEAGHRFVRCDAGEFLRRAVRQRRRYDLVILDPPTFGRVKGRRRPFVFRAALPALLKQAFHVLEPSGWLLICTNHRESGYAELESAVCAAAGGRPRIERVALEPDFAGDRHFCCSIRVGLGG